MTDSANSGSAVSIRTNDTATEYLVELFIIRNNEKTSSSYTVLGQIASTSELLVAKLIGHTAVYQYFFTDIRPSQTRYCVGASSDHNCDQQDAIAWSRIAYLIFNIQR